MTYIQSISTTRLKDLRDDIQFRYMDSVILIAKEAIDIELRRRGDL